MPVRLFIPLPGPFAWTPGPPGPSWGEQIVQSGDQVGGRAGPGLKLFGLYVGATIGVLKLGLLFWVLSFFIGDAAFMLYGAVTIYIGWILEKAIQPFYLRLLSRPPWHLSTRP